LKPGGVFIDGGAHIGYISLAASRYLGEAGRIFSFEPFGESYDLLRRNIESNRKSSVIRPVPRALWNAAGEIELAAPTDCSVSVMRGDICLSGKIRRIRVASIDIDSFCRDSEVAPSLIKLDIEGAEFEALRGARAVLEKFRPAVILELNEHHYRTLGMTIDDFLRPLLKSGYEKCYILSSRPGRAREFPASRGWGELEMFLKNRHLNCLFVA
jgi:FkbM family methyltransferase